MGAIPTYDAIVVGGGPAGSSCATNLVNSGVHTLLLDRSFFPRVKLCAGWVTAPVWDILELSTKEYPHGLWKFDKAHVHYQRRNYQLNAHGYFIRRYEFDDFLLKRSQVETRQGHHVQEIIQDSDGYWVIDQQFRTKYLVGAGGSHCPVARAVFPQHKKNLCGTQEKEFEANPREIAACRIGEDGEPEILLHDDLKGYSWNVPKSSWLNIGTGTAKAREVKAAWDKARAFFQGNGTEGSIPNTSRSTLDRMKGHGYVGFNANHLEFSQSNNVLLIGDALGLAQPLTGEGILPALLSGTLCAEAIISNAPESYQKRLQSHPTIISYQDLHSVRTWSKRRFNGIGGNGRSNSKLVAWLVVKIFITLFSGKKIPGLHQLAQITKSNPATISKDEAVRQRKVSH